MPTRTRSIRRTLTVPAATLALAAAALFASLANIDATSEPAATSAQAFWPWPLNVVENPPQPVANDGA